MLTNRLGRRCSRILRNTVFFAAVYCLVGCEQNSGKVLAYGELVSSFRFQVVLQDPVKPSEIFSAGHRLAAVNGFSVNLTDHIVAEGLDSALERRTIRFANSIREDRTRIPVDGMGLYQVSFTWEPEPSGLVSSFWFTFQLDGSGKFGEAEWVAFREWKNEILPGSFEGSGLIVRRHPAEFTEQSNWTVFSERTGVELPR